MHLLSTFIPRVRLFSQQMYQKFGDLVFSPLTNSSLKGLRTLLRLFLFFKIFLIDVMNIEHTSKG